MTPTLEDRVIIGNHVKWWVEEIHASIIADNLTEDYFWKEFVTELQRRNIVSSPQSPEGLTDQQGEEYGKRLCPFNQYKDIAYRAVPYDYLAFIVNSNKWLESYLKWRMKKGLTQ